MAVNWWRVRNYAKMATNWRMVIVIGQFEENENRKQIPRSQERMMMIGDCRRLQIKILQS